MKQINFPCVMVEKSNTYNRNTILNKFAVINDNAEMYMRSVYFINPVLTNDNAVVQEAWAINYSFGCDCLN